MSRTKVWRDCDFTEADYDKLLEYQGGGCAICERKPQTGKRLDLDHDHRTGLVRGLLCSFCNYDLLGCIGDDSRAARRFARAAGYIDNPPALQVFRPSKRHKSAPPSKGE